MIFEEIELKWIEFYETPFPREAYELDGLDWVSIDSFSAGCISVYVGNRGKLDGERRDCLRKCVSDLEQALPKLNGETRVYFDKLLSLSNIVLNATE